MSARLKWWMGIVAAVVAWPGAGPAAEGPLAIWAVDPHLKVFRDAQPSDAPRAVTLQAARNEYEPGQIAIRSPETLKGVRVELSPLTHADGKSTIGPEHLRWNFVGFIPLKQPSLVAEDFRAGPPRRTAAPAHRGHRDDR
jgi:hypothetical protein